MDADLRAYLPPRHTGDGELRIVHHNDEVRIAGGNLDARDCQPLGQQNRARCKRGKAHSGGHFHGERATGLQRVHAANAQARIGRNLQFIARL